MTWDKRQGHVDLQECLPDSICFLTNRMSIVSVTLRNVRELSRIAEQELHTVVLVCTRTRLSSGLSSSPPTTPFLLLA